MKKHQYQLEESIGFMLSYAHRLLRPLLEARVAGAGVSYGMWFFLRVLWQQDGMSQREIAARIGLSPPTALAALRRLERRRLIETRADPRDRRRIKIYLTDKGRSLEAELLPKVEQINAIALRGVSRSQVKSLYQVLRQIQRNAAEHRHEG